MSEAANIYYPPYYEGYVKHADLKRTITENLIHSRDAAIKFFASIPKEKEDYAYAPQKWTVKEVLQHCIDTERIFANRALRFARNDKTELPGFDEVAYGENMNCTSQTLAQLITEFSQLRESNIAMFEGFSEAQLARSGMASKERITVAAIGYINAGHLLHHVEIVGARYL